MSKKILLKRCGEDIYSYDTDGKLFLLKGEDKFEEVCEIHFDYDFFIDNENIYLLRDRNIYFNKKKVDVLLKFPVRIKILNSEIYVLDQEESTLNVYNKEFSLTDVFGKIGIDELENNDELYFMFPLDFDVFEERIAVIDVGNRRTVVFNKDLSFKQVFPFIGRKIRFYNKDTLLLLSGEEFIKIDLKTKNAEKSVIENILDFEIDKEQKIITLMENE